MTRRILWIVAATLLTSALGVLAIIVVLLGTERGTRWSLQLAHDYLPALSIEKSDGNWLHGLHIDTVQWRDSNIDLRISNIDVRLYWPSLLHNEIKLSTLRVRELRIETKDKSNNDPVKLPLLFLPSTLSAPAFALQQLRIINGDTTVALDTIGAAVRWRATTLRARELHIDWQGLHLHTNGDIGFRGDYPLRLTGELTVPQLPAPIALKTEGNVRQLLIHASIDKPYAVRSDIKLATLDPQLPLDIVAELIQPIALALPTGDLKLGTAKLHARGDLTRIDATLESTIDEPHYGTTQLNASAQWQPQQLQTSARWNLNRGVLQLDCNTTLTQPRQTSCNGTASAMDLRPWLIDEDGDISSAIKLEGKWSDAQWSLTLQLPDVHGHIGGETISGQLDLDSTDGALWQLRKLELASGPNKLSAQGKFGAQNQLQTDISARDLARLHPKLGGNLQANLLLSGAWPQPDLSGAWRGEKLRYDTLRIARSNAEFTLRKLGADRSLVRIDTHTFSVGEHAPVDLTLSVTGQREQQQLILNAHQSAHQIQLQCATRATQNFHNWQIDCPDFSGTVRTHALNENWRNSSPLSGRVLIASNTATTTAQTALELKPFCLRASDAELCLDQALRYERGQLQPTAAHGTALPLRWINSWLPSELQLENDARASLHAQLHSVAPLRAEASVTIPATQWEWLTHDGRQRAEINAVALTANLDAQRGALTASAHSPTLGDLNSQLTINDPRGRRELDGHIELQRIQLAGFAWLVEGLDALSGEINSDIRIAGTASAPQLRGKLLLQNGIANWAPLGAPFRDVHADLTFDNNSAKLGGWFALGQGGGDIDGDVGWDGAGDNWRLQLALIAGGLSAMPLPDSTVVFSPHMEMTAQPGAMRVKGYVDIASAEIALKQLPPDTIDVSQDQRIVGQQSDPNKMKLWAELGLNLGEQFHFGGFGADVNLSGRLQINKSPGDALHVNGEVRVPRGRYRAYGQRLSVRKGSFIFYGPLDNPDLNLEAVRDMPPGVTDVVGLRVIGSLKTPEALLFSEPSLPDSDIAYYLLTGHKPTTSTATNQYSASGALLSLGLAGSEDTAGKLAGKFGIRDLQLGTSEDSSGNTQAEISGQLGQDLYVRYGRGIGQRSNSISFQYRLTPKLMIETISGIEDALDLLYSFEIK